MKATEVRPGLVSFNDDNYRIEIGPRRILNGSLGLGLGLSK